MAAANGRVYSAYTITDTLHDLPHGRSEQRGSEVRVQRELVQVSVYGVFNVVHEVRRCLKACQKTRDEKMHRLLLRFFLPRSVDMSSLRVRVHFLKLQLDSCLNFSNIVQY